MLNRIEIPRKKKSLEKECLRSCGLTISPTLPKYCSFLGQTKKYSFIALWFVVQRSSTDPPYKKMCRLSITKGPVASTEPFDGGKTLLGPLTRTIGHFSSSTVQPPCCRRAVHCRTGQGCCQASKSEGQFVQRGIVRGEGWASDLWCDHWERIALLNLVLIQSKTSVTNVLFSSTRDKTCDLYEGLFDSLELTIVYHWVWASATAGKLHQI